MSNITLDNLSKEIIYDLKLYTEQVSKDIAEAVEECTEYADKEITANSPSKTGSYKKGWYHDTRHSETKSFGMVKHTAPDHRRVHLLELGHKARNFDSNGKMIAPVPHVDDGEYEARKLLDEKIDIILSTTK